MEFCAQYLALANGAAHPGVLHTSTRAVFEAALSLGLLAPADAESLLGAHRLFADVMQMTQLVFAGAPGDPLPREAARRVAAGAGLPDARALAGALNDARAQVRAVSARLIGGVD